mgnify:CR=1 FL=1
MKRLPKMLCALILCALIAAVSCGQKPAQQPQDRQIDAIFQGVQAMQTAE